MSSVASAHAPVHDGGHSHEENKFGLYVQIAMLLAVITGVEIVMVYLPFAHWLIFGGLTVLSIVKFMFVIFYFMHLRWDKPFCTVLFFIGLVLATGTVWALLQIFSAGDSKPLTAAALSRPVSALQVTANG